MLKAYSWLCAQEWLLVGLRGAQRVQEIKSLLDTCKTSHTYFSPSNASSTLQYVKQNSSFKDQSSLDWKSPQIARLSMSPYWNPAFWLMRKITKTYPLLWPWLEIVIEDRSNQSKQTIEWKECKHSFKRYYAWEDTQLLSSKTIMMGPERQYRNKGLAFLTANTS